MDSNLLIYINLKSSCSQVSCRLFKCSMCSTVAKHLLPSALSQKSIYRFCQMATFHLKNNNHSIYAIFHSQVENNVDSLAFAWHIDFVCLWKSKYAILIESIKSSYRILIIKQFCILYFLMCLNMTWIKDAFIPHMIVIYRPNFILPILYFNDLIN